MLSATLQEVQGQGYLWDDRVRLLVVVSEGSVNTIVAVALRL